LASSAVLNLSAWTLVAVAGHFVSDEGWDSTILGYIQFLEAFGGFLRWGYRKSPWVYQNGLVLEDLG